MARGGRRLRGVLGWLPALVLVPAATFAVVHVSDLDDEFVALREVHPLDLGTTWIYQVTDHEELRDADQPGDRAHLAARLRRTGSRGRLGADPSLHDLPRHRHLP